MNQPPFPKLEWDGHFWSCDCLLPSWAGFQSRGRNGRRRASGISDGTITLQIESTNPDKSVGPTKEQTTAFEYLMAHESEVAQAVGAAVVARYPEEREAYMDAYDDDAEPLPDVNCLDDLKSLMGLMYVFIMTEARSGMAYIGFQFGCEWEEEHGCGVLAHGSRVIQIGFADVAFDGRNARRDRENPE